MIAALSVVVLVVGLGSCGTEDPDSGGTAESGEAVPTKPFGPLPEKDPAIADRFPGSVTALKVAVNVQVPPAVFTNSDDEVIGFEADLMRAIGALSGREIEFSGIDFSSLIPGLLSDRYDIGVATIGIHPEREAELDMIQDSAAGNAIVTLPEYDGAIDGLDDLCGEKAGVLAGSVYFDQVEVASRKCLADGGDAIDLHSYPQQADADLALQNERIDVVIFDQMAASYLDGQQPGTIKMHTAYDVNPTGISLLKGSELTAPVQAALQKLMDDGTYDEIMDYWGASNASVPEAKLGK